MNWPLKKILIAAAVAGVLLMGAMFVLPVISAVLIGFFALSGLLWLSGKVARFFRPEGAEQVAPGDDYGQPRRRIIPDNWSKGNAQDVDVIRETDNK